MSPFNISHLLISREESLFEYLTDTLDGEVRVSKTLETTFQKIEQQWPNSIILDGRIEAFNIEWIFAFRDAFSIAEIPLVLLMTEENSTFEKALAFLPRVSIIHLTDNSQANIPMFVEMLVDEHTRDAFYEKVPNLITLERITKLWQENESAQIIYSRSLPDGSSEPGHQVRLYRGGIRQVRDKDRLIEALCDPDPVIKSVSDDVVGDWLTVAEILYHSLKHHTRPGFLRVRQWYGLLPTEQSSSAKDLPMELATRKLLRQREHQSHSIAKRLQALGYRSTQIEVDVEILVRMGLYKLQVPEELNRSSQTQTDDLPQIPPNRWHSFLRSTLQEFRHRTTQHNPWKAWNWDPSEAIEPQISTSKDQLRALEELSSLDDHRDLQIVRDHIDSVEQWLKRWQHCYHILGIPPDEEHKAMYDAFAHLKKQNLSAAINILESLAHPFPRAIYLWLKGSQVLDSPSEIRPILIELSGILDMGFLPLFEAYASVLQMGMGHWSNADKRIQSLHSSHQKRALLWSCHRQQIDSNLWVFWQW